MKLNSILVGLGLLSLGLARPAMADSVWYRQYNTAPSTQNMQVTPYHPDGKTRYQQLYYGDENYLNAYRRVIASYNPALSAEQLDTIVRSILCYSDYYKVDPRFVTAVFACESAFRPHAVSGAGAQGVGQLMPDTARELKVDPMVPYQNIQGSIRYLKLNLDRFAGYKKRERYRLCLAAYNAGYGAVQQYGGVPPYAETQNYVNVVMSEYTRLSGER
jgi:soluble lytic murein transglycosylase-like protein